MMPPTPSEKCGLLIVAAQPLMSDLAKAGNGRTALITNTHIMSSKNTKNYCLGLRNTMVMTSHLLTHTRWNSALTLPRSMLDVNAVRSGERG
jgi:hypothetical protein